MATVYHRDQAGAPALTTKQIAADVAHFTALKEVLKACLVNGYGSTLPSGWTLINEGADFIVLRNGSQSGYVCLSWTTAIVRVYLSETYTGMNGKVMTGVGLKTGTDANNQSPHCFNNYALVWGSDTMTWSMIADAKTFVLCMGYHTAVTGYTPGVTSPGALTLYVGEDSAGHFIAVGGLNGTFTTTSTFTVPNSRFDAGGVTSLRNPSTGLLIDTGSLSVKFPGLRVVYGPNESETSDIVLSEVALAHIPWIGGDAYAGWLRGVAFAPALSFTTAASPAARSLGYPGTLTVRNANTPLDMGDIYTYFPRLAHHFSAFFLITDNPEFW